MALKLPEMWFGCNVNQGIAAGTAFDGWDLVEKMGGAHSKGCWGGFWGKGKGVGVKMGAWVIHLGCMGTCSRHRTE